MKHKKVMVPAKDYQAKQKSMQSQEKSSKFPGGDGTF